MDILLPEPTAIPTITTETFTGLEVRDQFIVKTTPDPTKPSQTSFGFVVRPFRMDPSGGAKVYGKMDMKTVINDLDKIDPIPEKEAARQQIIAAFPQLSAGIQALALYLLANIKIPEGGDITDQPPPPAPAPTS